MKSVGGYAVSTTSRPWLSTPISTPVPRQKRGKATRGMVNPLFDDLSKLTTDPYWIGIFSKAAYGKMPRKFSFKDGILMYKRGMKVHSTDIPSNPSEALPACTQFFRHFGGLYSEIEQQSARDAEAAVELTRVEETQAWSKIKKKMKEIMIDNYAADLSEAMSLSEIETNQLRDILMMGVTNGHFSKDNIHMSLRHIIHIDGLNFDDNTRLFSIDSRLVPRVIRSNKSSKKVETTATKDSGVTFYKNWCKMVAHIERKDSDDVSRDEDIPTDISIEM